jgi:hypothetical protein
MPIIARTQSQNQQLDEYPQAAQAFQMALGIVDAAQRNRQLSLAETGQAADIRQGDEQLAQGRERIGIANRDLDFRDQRLKDENQFAADTARGADALLGGQPGIQGPPVPPGVEGDNSDFEIEAVRYTASQMKSPQAQAQFLQDAATTLKQRRVQRDTQGFATRLASSVKASTAMPGGEQFAPYKERYAQMLDSIAGMDPEQGEMVLREAMQGLAQIEKLELENAQLVTAQADGLAMLDQLTGTLPLGSPLKSKLMAYRGLIAGADSPKAVTEAMSKAFNLSIDYQPPVVVEIDGRLTELSPEAYANYVQRRDAQRERSRIADERLAADQGKPPTQRSVGAATVRSFAEERILKLDKKGEAEFPVLGPDGKQENTDTYLFGAVGGNPKVTRRAPTEAEYAEAMRRAEQILRGAEAQPQAGPPQASQPPAGSLQDQILKGIYPPDTLSEEEWLKQRERINQMSGG